MLGKELDADSDRIDVFRYGLEIILGGILKFFAVAITSYFIGTFETTMSCIISYIPIRHFGGGVHLSTYYRCLIIGTIMFILLGRLSINNINRVYLTLAIIIIYCLGIYIISIWAPARTEQKSIICEREKQKLKKKTIYTLTVLVLLNILLIRFNLLNYVLASILGVLVSLIFITPWGYKAINTLNNILDKIKGGRINV